MRPYIRAEAKEVCRRVHYLRTELAKELQVSLDDYEDLVAEAERIKYAADMFIRAIDERGEATLKKQQEARLALAPNGNVLIQEIE